MQEHLWVCVDSSFCGSVVHDLCVMETPVLVAWFHTAPMLLLTQLQQRLQVSHTVFGSHVLIPALCRRCVKTLVPSSISAPISVWLQMMHGWNRQASLAACHVPVCWFSVGEIREHMARSLALSFSLCITSPWNLSKLVCIYSQAKKNAFVWLLVRGIALCKTFCVMLKISCFLVKKGHKRSPTFSSFRKNSPAACDTHFFFFLICNQLKPSTNPS